MTPRRSPTQPSRPVGSRGPESWTPPTRRRRRRRRRFGGVFAEVSDAFGPINVLVTPGSEA
jgi:hypothetical protein